MERKNKKGITLIALIITIIVLLVLAGISIQLISHKGILEQSKQAEQKSKREQIVEWLNLKLLEVQIDKFSKPNATPIIETIRNNIIKDQDELEKIGGNVSIEDIRDEEDGKDVDDYFYVIVDEDVYKVTEEGVEVVGKVTDLTPIIKLEKIYSTTSEITVEVSTKYNTNGKIEYYIKGEDDTDYKLIESTSEEKYTYTTLEQNKNYSIKIVAVTSNGKTAEVFSGASISADSDSKSITVNVIAKDVAITSTNGYSEIKGYYYSIDDGANYTDITSNNSYKFDGLKQGTTYYIKVKVEDNAGNILELSTTKDTIPITLTLSTTSGTVVNGSSQTATVSGDNYGTLSATSSDTNVATASISGNTLTVTGTITSGTNTATITVAGSEGGSATYTVTAHKHTGSSSSGGGCYTKASTSSYTYYCSGCRTSTYTYKCSGCTEDCSNQSSCRATCSVTCAGSSSPTACALCNAGCAALKCSTTCPGHSGTSTDCPGHTGYSTTYSRTCGY